MMCKFPKCKENLFVQCVNIQKVNLTYHSLVILS